MAHTGQVLQAFGKVTQKGLAYINGQDKQEEMMGGMEGQKAGGSDQEG